MAVGSGVAVPLLVLYTSYRIGHAIHHQIEENRLERTDLARSFGL